MSDAVDNPIQATDLVKATEQEALGEAPATSVKPSQTSIEHLLDIPLRLSIELGRTRMAIGELLMLNPGSVIEPALATTSPKRESSSLVGSAVQLGATARPVSLP